MLLAACVLDATEHICPGADLACKINGVLQIKVLHWKEAEELLAAEKPEAPRLLIQAQFPVQGLSAL